MRKERIERFIAVTVGTYIHNHISLVETSFFLSVTKVTVSPSLELAQVYVSLLGEGDKEAFLKTMLSKHHLKIKQEVTSKLKRQIRRVPREIRFYIDNMPAHASKLSVAIDRVSEEEK
jgi:ribosome-binding factor A